tara:strand:+ start:276 stop:920 length:645 start_codon:yes stop_codon:yes gene_type:complete
MCGRFSLHSSKERVIKQYGAQIPFDFSPNYNIGPSQNVIALTSEPSSKRIIARQLKWGMHPQREKTKKLLINARCESVHTKPTFIESFRQSRCIIIADGWFEWLRENNQKKPHYFFRKDTRLLAFAGLILNEEEKGHCAILTRSAPTSISHIHNRMPLSLTREQVNLWLSNKSFSHVSENAINELDTSIIDYYPVSQKVNSIKNNTSELIFKEN